MTVIVYKDGILAADSQTGNTDFISPYEIVKVKRGYDGSVFAGTGDPLDYAEFSRVLESGKTDDGVELTPQEIEKRLVVRGSSLVVRAMPDRSVRVYDRGMWMDRGKIPHGAWGTGAIPAIAALVMGADAYKAVWVACQVDPQCGGAQHGLEIIGKEAA